MTADSVVTDPAAAPDQLLPCPFCGGDATLAIGHYHFHDAMVVCEDCGAEGPMINVDDRSHPDQQKRKNIESASNLWNRRA